MCFSCAEFLTHNVALYSPSDLTPLTAIGRRKEEVLTPLKTLISWLGSQFIGPRQAYAVRRQLNIRDFFTVFMVAARPVPSLNGLNSFVKLHLAEVAGFFSQTMEEIIDSLKGQVMLPVAAVEHLIPRFVGDATEYLGLYTRWLHEDAVATWVRGTRILAQLRVRYLQITSGPEEEMDCLLHMLKVMDVITAYERTYPDINFQEQANQPPGGPQGPGIDDNNLIPY
jgi:hypothetical protein